MIFHMIICSLKVAASSDSHHEGLLPLEYWRIKKCTAQNANVIRSHTSASRRDARRGNAVSTRISRVRRQRSKDVRTSRRGAPAALQISDTFVFEARLMDVKRRTRDVYVSVRPVVVAARLSPFSLLHASAMHRK